MNLKTILIASVALAIGVAAGWISKPEQAAPSGGERRSASARKARIAESKTRVKTVTTVVTNTVHDTVTNTVEIQRGAGGWREDMERLKEENPAEYVARTNRMANFRNMMLQNAENRLQTLASIDTTGWTERQLETHQRYQELIAQREELMELMRPDSGATDRQRKESFSQMHDLMRELHRTANAERSILLSKTISALGYKGQAAKEVKTAIETIFSTTQEFGGFGRHGGHRGPPPR